MSMSLQAKDDREGAWPHHVQAGRPDGAGQGGTGTAGDTGEAAHSTRVILC